jgi:hypothetical protein
VGVLGVDLGATLQADLAATFATLGFAADVRLAVVAHSFAVNVRLGFSLGLLIVVDVQRLSLVEVCDVHARGVRIRGRRNGHHLQTEVEVVADRHEQAQSEMDRQDVGAGDCAELELLRAPEAQLLP